MSEEQIDSLINDAETAPSTPSGSKRRIVALASGIGAVLIASLVILGAYLAGWFGSGDETATPSVSTKQNQQNNSDTAQGATEQEPEITEEKPATPTIAQNIAEQYGKVLDNIASYDFLGGVEPQPGDEIDGYNYALTDMTGDGVPELVVETRAAMLTNVRVFSPTTSADGLIAPEESLQTGIAGAGGFRGGVSGTKDGSGLYYTVTSSGTGDVEIAKVTINGSTLVQTRVAEYSLDPSQGKPEPQDIAANTVDLEFKDVADRTPLTELATKEFKAIGNSKAETPANASSQETSTSETNGADDAAVSLQKSIEAARASGAQVFEGTVRVLSYNEVLQLQGVADPNPGTDAGSQFAILVFDRTTDVKGHNGGDPGMRTEAAKMLLLDSYDVSQWGSTGSPEKVNRWKAVNGKHVVVACKDIWFPSDTRLPLGEPGTDDAKLLSK